MNFVATTTRGAEPALAAELEEQGIANAVPSRGAVYFSGGLDAGYRACLWSRLASRVLLQVHRGPADSADALYETVKSVPWGEHLSPNGTFATDFVGGADWIKNTRFAMYRCKDGLVDRMREQYGQRPSVELGNPDVRVNVHVSNGEASVAIDLSGIPLHIRSGGRATGHAPMKETLAATILRMTGWPALALEGVPLVDPMCGSGTFLLEGAGMAYDIAPGFARQKWGFAEWLGHNATIWNTLREEAKDRRADARNRDVHIMGYDIDPTAVKMSRDNAVKAGMPTAFNVAQRRFADSSPESQQREGAPRGLLVVNPPYGERMQDEATAVATYKEIGDVLRRRYLGWKAGVYAGTPALGKKIWLKPTQRIVLHNGPIEGRLLIYDIHNKPVARDAS